MARQVKEVEAGGVRIRGIWSDGKPPEFEAWKKAGWSQLTSEDLLAIADWVRFNLLDTRVPSVNKEPASVPGPSRPLPGPDALATRKASSTDLPRVVTTVTPGSGSKATPDWIEPARFPLPGGG